MYIRGAVGSHLELINITSAVEFEKLAAGVPAMVAKTKRMLSMSAVRLER